MMRVSYVRDKRTRHSGRDSWQSAFRNTDLADRNHENYTQIVYCVEPRHLMRAKELFVVAHVVNETAPYTFYLVL